MRRHARLALGERVLLWALAGLVLWTGVSATWSAAPAASILEAERALVYVGAVAALLFVARTRWSRDVLGALLVAISVVAGIALATRLAPDRIGVYDRSGVYRLAEPIGYWNGLAVFTGMGALLALGFAARARTLAARSACAAALVLLLPTLYFTFGRAAWIALAAGLAVAVAVDPRRLQLLATLLVVGPAPAAAVLLASRETGLTHEGTALARAAHDGHRLGLVLLALGAANALLSAAFALISSRVRPPVLVTRAFALAATAAVVAGVGAVLVRYGGPARIADRAWTAFKAPPPHVQGNLNRRLLSFSGNGRADLWRLALDQAGRHPLLGDGAGTYERYFLAHQPPRIGRVRDAHGLYVETLAELGPLGLGLLVLALATPLLVAGRARRHRIVPAAVGAYVAYLVHAGVDWDWELPAVTLVALFCGATILLVDRRSAAPTTVANRPRWVIAAVAVVSAAFAGVTLIGNTDLSRSAAAGGRDPAEAAVQARRAHLLLPWSPAPWDALGRAQLAVGLVGDARRSFRRAVSIDPGDWELWYDLSGAAEGRARAHALDRVAALFPRSGLVPAAAGRAGGKP